MNRLKNKAVIITGASKGIGRGIAKVFAHEGAEILLVGRDLESLKNVQTEIESCGGKAAYYSADVSCEDETLKIAEDAIRRFGRIDVLCHNAGIYPQNWLEEMTSAQWDQVLDTNLKSAFLMVKACLPSMKEKKDGSIVMTSSISGPQVGWPGGAHYTASKAGMNGFMKTAAIELAKYQITFNVVEPGNIATEGLSACSAEHIQAMARATPLGRLGTPEDVANAALFLASDEARFITGQSIVVDGGQILPESHFQKFWN